MKNNFKENEELDIIVLIEKIKLMLLSLMLQIFRRSKNFLLGWKKLLIVIIAGIMGIILGLFISFIQEHIINLSLKEKNKYNEAKILAFKNIAQLFGKN